MRALPRWLNLAPAPPPAGRQKLADARAVRRQWLLTILAVLLGGTLLWPRGLGTLAGQMRREVVSAGYLRAAQAAYQSRPIQRERALTCLRRALRVAPQPERYAGEAATLFLALRAYPEAWTWLRRQPDAVLTHISQAQCLYLMGKSAEAGVLMEQALQELARLRAAGAMPDALYALTLNNAGYVLSLAGRNLTEAREYVSRALTISPLMPAYIDSMGWVEYRQGRFQEAAFYLERALRHQGREEDPEMLYHLGACYARQGKVQAARQMLRRCLAADPSLGEARRLLDGLRQALPPPALVHLSPRRAGGDA